MFRGLEPARLWENIWPKAADQRQVLMGAVVRLSAAGAHRRHLVDRARTVQPQLPAVPNRPFGLELPISWQPRTLCKRIWRLDFLVRLNYFALRHNHTTVGYREWFATTPIARIHQQWLGVWTFLPGVGDGAC